MRAASRTGPELRGSTSVAEQRLGDAVRFCTERRNLRRTIRIALVVGVVLTLINQSAVIASDHATTATWVRCVLNFIVPFLVSNAGLLSARR